MTHVAHDLRSALEKAVDERNRLRTGALQRRIILDHRIGCIAYALGEPIEEVLAYFVEAAGLVDGLLTHGSIEPSLALSAWGICALGGRRDEMRRLAEMNVERLGSQHAPARYTRMLASIFRANQEAWREDREAVREQMRVYDRELVRKRTNRAFARWAQGLRDLHVAWSEGSDIDGALKRRQRYLEADYPSHEVDHEGLLDVHGIGVVAATNLGGWRLDEERTPLPITIEPRETT